MQPQRRLSIKTPPVPTLLASPATKKLRLSKKTTMEDAPMLGPGHFSAPGTTVDLAFGWVAAFLDDEQLAAEDVKCLKCVYLVTLPHPRVDFSSKDLTSLRAPGDFTHSAIETIILDVFSHPVHADPGNVAQSQTQASVRLTKFVVFRESHAASDGAAGPGNKHYHIALAASRSFRFMPFKRSLRQRHGLASHWSTTHTGYWSAVRYGFIPTPKKPQWSLDASPRVWCADGQHASLFEASQEPTTAAAMARRRQACVKHASEEGRREPKPTELDLYAIIVQQVFRNTADDQHAVKRLVQYLKLHGSPALVAFAFHNRQKLAGILEDVWAWESVDDALIFGTQTRFERLQQASTEPCACGGAWRHYAELALHRNGINKKDVCSHVVRLLKEGRHEAVPVLVFVGKYGGEGKSFFLAPLRSLYGVDNVQGSPLEGGYPLLGLETKKVALLDEYRFCEQSLSLTTQLLWFEGKAFVITRPQNHVFGHLMYKGTAPVFITTKEPHLRTMALAAHKAIAAGVGCEETMLLRRLCVYHFQEKLVLPAGLRIVECAGCFARMILHYSGLA